MILGLISDTHGFLDERVPRIFAGVDHILHAGDIGPASIIVELERIAPVTAVLGNNDWDERFRETESIELAGRKFLIHHIVVPGRPSETLSRRLKAHQPDIVVFGHTHAAAETRVNGTLFVNPGYAGKPRFSQPRSVALLEVAESGLKVRFIDL
jgi:uncharacterized protein